MKSTSSLNKLKETRIANRLDWSLKHRFLYEINLKCSQISIKGNLDILMVSETKLDSTFPSNLFTVEGYVASIRFDRNGIELICQANQINCFYMMGTLGSNGI